MKRKILISLLVVIIIAVGAGGGVYAVENHQPVVGQKLVGHGVFGTKDLYFRSIVSLQSFGFSNPDCLGEITITKVSVIRNSDGFDTPPEMVYEGPYIAVLEENTGTGLVLHREVLIRPLMPHEGGGINLAYYMYTGAGADPGDLTDSANWLTPLQAWAQDWASYTVEIEWEAQNKVCPLTGSTFSKSTETELIGPDAGEIYKYSHSSKMTNFSQHVKKVK